MIRLLRCLQQQQQAEEAAAANASSALPGPSVAPESQRK